MRRALDRLSSEQFDLLIIGGGATGCFAAREAAMRGLCVALVEADDFAAATSAHNSKLAHGGLRYLRNGEIGLVRESLRERAALLRIAPHLVRPLPFLLPLYGKGWRERLTLNIGLSLYDLLAADCRPKLPRHHFLPRRAALDAEPVLEGPRFEGAFVYHDAQMYSPERIALECVIDADAQGAAIDNHLQAETLMLRDGKVLGASTQDRLSGARFDIQARRTLI